MSKPRTSDYRARRGTRVEIEAGRTAFHENRLTGPLREQYHGLDAEGAGRSRYWDTPTSERAKQVPEILKLTVPFSSAYDQEFARGWLAEMARAREAGRKTLVVEQERRG